MDACLDLDWLVIGAGCAGIAAVGKLIDHGVNPRQIGWLDPCFQVGDLGKKWLNVSSNTHVGLFLKFLRGCTSFDYDQCRATFPIHSLNPQDTCYLREIVAPLQWVTDHLLAKVHQFKGEALALKFHDGLWVAKLKDSHVAAKNVILAIGADPKVLSLSHSAEMIPLEAALDPHKLSQSIKPNDRVGVFGSSHSAVWVLSQVLKLDLQKVYNFYKTPHLYAVYLEDWILFDDSGLKGNTAKWARENLDGPLPKKLERIPIYHPSFKEALASCTKVIYAVGFERRKIPVIEPYSQENYQKTTGIIAPQLFGVGIAYPQAKYDRFGNLEYRVGLWKFLDFLNTMVPIWLQYAKP